MICRKTVLILIIILLTCNITVTCSETAETELYNQFHSKAESYGYNDAILSGNNVLNGIIREFGKNFKSNLYIYCIVLLIYIISAFICSLFNDKNISVITKFSGYCICGVMLVTEFKDIMIMCRTCITDLLSFMDFAIAVYAGVLANSGFVSIAASFQMNFALLSAFVSHILKNIISPFLLCCGLLSITNGLTSFVDIGGFIQLIKKIIKYIIGICLTVFSGVLTFSGFAGAASDNVTIRTAKYAVTNFVPVVGSYLSEILNNIVNSSLVLKNSIGNIGFITVLTICLIPIIKLTVSIFLFKIISSSLELITKDTLSVAVNSISDILEIALGILLIISVIFILLIAIIASIGV